MPEKTTKKSTFYPVQKQNIEKYGLSSEKLYDIISEDPDSFASYYNAIIEDYDKEENTPEIQEFLSNINRRFAKQFGFAYDPMTTRSLRPIREDNPEYQKIINFSNNYYKNQQKSTEPEKKDSTYQLPSTKRTFYGSSMYGVGGEDLPEYNWWRQSTEQSKTDNFKKNYPQYDEFLKKYPPSDTTSFKPSAKVRRLKNVENEYDDSDRVVNENGVVFKNPGHRFYKTYDDGSKEEISEIQYREMLPFNSLPENLKNKYMEEI